MTERSQRSASTGSARCGALSPLLLDPRWPGSADENGHDLPRFGSVLCAVGDRCRDPDTKSLTSSEPVNCGRSCSFRALRRPGGRPGVCERERASRQAAQAGVPPLSALRTWSAPRASQPRSRHPRPGLSAARSERSAQPARPRPANPRGPPRPSRRGSCGPSRRRREPGRARALSRGRRLPAPGR